MKAVEATWGPHEEHGQLATHSSPLDTVFAPFPPSDVVNVLRLTGW